MSDCIEFGFDSAQSIIRAAGAEVFKQNRHGEKHRISIISFLRIHDSKVKEEMKRLGRALTDEEKASVFAKVDQARAEQLKKTAVDQLTDADRLDVREPKFWSANTHFSEGIGTIKCLSKYEGQTVVRPEECCNRFGLADQKFGTIIMTYPVDKDGQVDGDLLKLRKYTNFYIWVLSSKKLQKVDTIYKEAKMEDPPRRMIDLRVTLDGDPKFQKQNIEAASVAYWARNDVDPDTRHWIFDQGLRLQKYVSQNLGYSMKLDKLMEKLSSGGGSGSGSGSQSYMANDVPNESPKLVSSYEDFIK